MSPLFLLRHALYTELSLNHHEVAFIIISNIISATAIVLVFGAISLFFILGQLALAVLLLISLYKYAAKAAKSAVIKNGVLK